MAMIHPNVTTLAAITDVAVCSQAPHHILIATEQGNVHLYTDVETPTGVVWSCHGGPLRVGWVGTRAIAWNADPASRQMFVLDPDGQVRKQHQIPPHCDLATCNGGFFIATGQVRLAHYELARDGSCSREERSVAAPGGYDAGSLTVSRSGTVALRSGGLVQLQTKPSRPWQDVREAGVVPALSPQGTRLATSWPYEDGSHVHSFTVTDSAVVLETPYAVRALPAVITNLDWSADDSMLLAYARREGDVRVFFRDGWVPGLWTHSAIRPGFHPSGIVTVPKTRDRLIANAPRGASSKTWARWRETTPPTFTVTGAGSMRQGDKVVVFQREPRTHPTSIYEVVGAHRKDDDVSGLADPPALCRLRLGIAPVSDRLLDVDVSALAAIEESETGEVDAAVMRALMERLLSDQPDTRQQMRMHLATSLLNSPPVEQTPPPAAPAPAPAPAQATSTRVDESAAAIAETTGSISSPGSSPTPTEPGVADSMSGSGDAPSGPTPTSPSSTSEREPSDETTQRGKKDRKVRAAAAVAMRRQLLDDLYDAYMESSATFLQYDGSVPDAAERAREAEWLKSHEYIKGTIGADHFLSLQLTPHGRDHVEATSAEPAETPTASLTNGESPSVIGTFELAPLAPTIGLPSTFEKIIGEGVDVLLVTAVDVERDAMLRHMTPLDGHVGVIRAPIKDHVYFLGKLGDTVAALVMTRMGASMRDGSTLAVNEAIGTCKPRAVIAVGMAWGMSTKLRLADVLVSTQIGAFDVARRQATGDVYRAAKPEAGGLLLNRFRNVMGWKFTRPDGYVCAIKDGPMLSGESLIDDLAYKTKLHLEFPDAVGGEMEGTGIYGASAKNRGEWIIVKAICDWADGTKDKRAQPVATAAAASLVAHVVSERGALDSLPRMAVPTTIAGSRPSLVPATISASPVAATTNEGAPDTKPSGPASTDAWRVEKRATKRAEVAAETLVAALAFLDGLVSVVSVFVTTRRDPDPDDPRDIAGWKAEIGERWGTFAPISNRFVDAIRLAETHLPDEVNELLQRVWMERASIKASQATYFQTPSASEFFTDGFGGAPERRLTALREECRRVLRPIVQLE